MSVAPVALRMHAIKIAKSTSLSLTAIGLALLVSAILILLAGFNPLVAYGALIKGAFGDSFAIGNTLARTTPLIFTGLAVAFAFRCNLLNIGAEGQLYAGALASVIVGIFVTGLPTPLHIMLAIAAGFAAGAMWGGLAGLMKSQRGINEIVSTIMLNFVAIFFVSYMVQGPIAEPPGFFHQTAQVAITARLPLIAPKSDLSIGILIAVGCAIFIAYLLWRTPFGLRLRTVGRSEGAARFSGIRVNRYMFGAMSISGGLAGLAGTVEIIGSQYRLLDFFSPGYGFDGIAVAFLGRSDPIGVIFAAFLFAALRIGANQMQRTTGLPTSLVLVIQGTVILFILGAGILQWYRQRQQAKGA
jgi:simple sugar transport system permease protein